MSASDLSNFPRDEWENRTVADAMTAASRLFSLSPDDTLSVAADLIAAKNVNQLPVLDEGRLLGFVTRADVIRVLQVREEVGADSMQDENSDKRLVGRQ